MRKAYSFLRKILPVVIIIAVLLLLSQMIYARAGGAGGGSRSGGGNTDDGDGFFDILFDIIELGFQNPALGAMAFFVFLLIIYLSNRKTKDQ